MSTDKPQVRENLTNSIASIKYRDKSSISPTKMVLSTIPLEGGHVVIRQSNGSSQLTTANMQSQQQQQQQQHHHHQQQQQQQQQQHHLINTNQTNGYSTTTTQMHHSSPSSTLITTSSTKNTYISNVGNNISSNGNAMANTIPTQSKYVFLQQNGNGQYTTNEVVLLATEPVDMGTTTEQVISVNEAGTATVCDEELTSLSWLHDKNLLKGFVPCSKNSRKATEQRIQAQSNGGGTPVTIINAGGQVSPTSEYIEESPGISEENTSNIEHAINEYSSQPHIHYSTTTTTTTTNNNNNNNHALVKNRNGHQILSPIHTANNGGNYINSSQSSSIHEQVSGSLAAIGATTTVHVGPSGTTTVVEYKTNSNFAQSRLSGGNGVNSSGSGGTTITPAANNYVPSSPQRNIVLTNVASPHHQQQQHQQFTSSSNNSNSTLSTTHHPHKKYLREKMNGFDQSGGGGTNNSGGGSSNKNSNANIPSPFSSSSSTGSSASSPASSGANFAINTVSHTSSQGVSTLSPEPPREYHTQNVHLHSVMKSPASYSTNSYENDSLKDFELTSVPSTNNGRIPSSINAHQHSQQQHQPLPLQKSSPTPPKQKHPTNVPYDPLVHTHNKPPYSFSSLIFMAIEGSTEKALPVKEIYAWIVQHFPYFKTAPTGWKNSVRHNLSLNKSFVKVEKAPNMGKGSLWRVEQQQRQNLIQALSRSPFFPNSAVDKISLKSPTGSTNGIVMPNSPAVSTESDGSPPMTPGKCNLDARLFPNLSKAIKLMETNDQDDDSPSDYSTIKAGNGYYTNGNSTPNGSFENIELMARDCGTDSIDDVNAATAMLALKHGPKVFNETFQNGSPVITSSPSEDHTYSAGGGGVSSTSNTNGTTANNNTNSSFNGSMIANGSGDKPAVPTNGFSPDNQSNCASSDAAYESSEESHNISPEELEDQQRHRDGVYALLSLSSHVDMSPIKRPSSTTVEEEHISSYMENIPHLNGKGLLVNGCGALVVNGSGSGVLDEGYNTQSYYSHMASPSPPKKQKPLRNIRAKIKRKTTLIR
ncbi:myosin-G heavy chain isoform X2 [Eupeodes corollae]|nr:myosin-G heavy chain isoform X2 [Eupeodes corollae]XP_055908387.1 myosin-G heavy chain isoform X2 [Eupeodes corollae]XP_055908388.1 myosin-G heavy chain isoform X2 [Eupeodes corollae]XP_055908390.1 myosin-G heavy chain isoform X2 [Eupeodes corollae]XP_055908391.1 myosin-G heavy chain isoform X2 [Eupeodes corollae]XP_055908392.1 myosin-G heavy chain isoform X2 [Eupeodes corollae]